MGRAEGKEIGKRKDSKARMRGKERANDGACTVIIRGAAIVQKISLLAFWHGRKVFL